MSGTEAARIAELEQQVDDLERTVAGLRQVLRMISAGVLAALEDDELPALHRDAADLERLRTVAGVAS